MLKSIGIFPMRFGTESLVTSEVQSELVAIGEFSQSELVAGGI
jgi:hypothetical protein